MRKVYVSDITGKQYDTEEECVKAENAVSAEKLERKDAAKRVDDKLEAYNKARQEALDELNTFKKKYGPFKTTINDAEMFFLSPFEWLSANWF